MVACGFQECKNAMGLAFFIGSILGLWIDIFYQIIKENRNN